MSKEMDQTQSSAIDPYKVIQITPNPDGSITRNTGGWPKTAATPDPPADVAVLTKDVTINQSNNTWLRIFLPRSSRSRQPPPNNLPLLVYYHGGGFVICSPDLVMFHDFCAKVAVQLQAVVVSVRYRLAPEHRLPAAYDDAVEALHWFKDTQEEWLTKNVDLSKCFLMGSSAGGNLAYHAGLRAAAETDNLLPLKIKGLILHQPFFGGVERSGSEIRLYNEEHLPVCATDLMWDLSLPIGADRDHEYSNPTVEGGSKVIDQIKSLEWRVMVIGSEGDPLIDRQIELAKYLTEKKGIQVVSWFSPGGFHGVEFVDPSKMEALIGQIKDFVFSSAW